VAPFEFNPPKSCVDRQPFWSVQCWRPLKYPRPVAIIKAFDGDHRPVTDELPTRRFGDPGIQAAAPRSGLLGGGTCSIPNGTGVVKS